MADNITDTQVDILNRMNADAQKAGLGDILKAVDENVDGATLSAFTGNWATSNYKDKTLVAVLDTLVGRIEALESAP